MPDCLCLLVIASSLFSPVYAADTPECAVIIGVKSCRIVRARPMVADGDLPAAVVPVQVDKIHALRRLIPIGDEGVAAAQLPAGVVLPVHHLDGFILAIPVKVGRGRILCGGKEIAVQRTDRRPFQCGGDRR